MNRSDYFEKVGVVSVWLGLVKPEPNDDVDILRDRCGVESYDLDLQDVIIVREFEEAPIADILGQLSYSESFLDAAVRAAEVKEITKARWVMGQYDFAYDPVRVYVPVAADPVYIGNFLWSDEEER